MPPQLERALVQVFVARVRSSIATANEVTSGRPDPKVGPYVCRRGGPQVRLKTIRPIATIAIATYAIKSPILE
jgi:hypothetical protein